MDKGQEALTIFAVNRNRQEPLALTGELCGLSGYRVDQHLVLTDEDASASNTIENPDRVRPRSEPGAKVADDYLRAVLLPLSWNVIHLRRERGTA